MKERAIRDPLTYFLLVVTVSLTPLLGACRSTIRGPDSEPASSPSTGTDEPRWRYQPHSWDKMAAITNWLAGSGPEKWPELVPEAELDLAEGRLRFAEEEASKIAPSSMEIRLNGAAGGFQRVLATPGLNPIQERRAQTGLRKIEGLRSGGTQVGKLDIRSRTAWRAKAPALSRLTRTQGAYRRITVHHSAKEIPTHGTTMGQYVDAWRKIQTVHMRDRRFGDIGYHFLISPDGTVYSGRDLKYQGAHASGKNNVGNIGICLLGHFDRESPPAVALRSLDRLIDALGTRHGIPRTQVYGHGELTATACPGTRLMAWVERYRGGIAKR